MALASCCGTFDGKTCGGSLTPYNAIVMDSSSNLGDAPVPSFREALRVWIKVAALSFGGPAGQIAVMHRLVVEERKWLSEARFLHALNYCMLLPGPEAQQLATYIGWLLHGWRGGLTAGLLFILPGFVSILVLSALYAGYQGAPLVSALFFGLKPAVLAVVLQAVWRLGARALNERWRVMLAGLAFVAIFALHVPFPWIVFGAALAGVGVQRWGVRSAVDTSNVVGPATPLGRSDGADMRADNTENISPLAPHAHAEPTREDASQSDRPQTGKAYRLGTYVADSPAVSQHTAHAKPASAHKRPRMMQTLATVLLWGAIWWLPIGVLALALGPEDVLVQLGVFFGRVAVVTFGGAYAVLAYVAQQAVDVFGWLQPGEMLDGLGLAETTPGPLIQVVQFVGHLAAYRTPGALAPAWSGLWGAVIVTSATFAPCFLWIFAGAPYIEALRHKPALNAALSAITAAVVGVILNLAVWFAVHTLFGATETMQAGALHIDVPVWSTLDVTSLVLAALAAWLLIGRKWGLLTVIAVSVVLGMASFAVLQ